MITEEMLREAAHKASEVLTAYYERDYDPQKQYEIPPEFEKRIQDLIDGKMPGRLNALRRFIKRHTTCAYQNGNRKPLLPFWYVILPLHGENQTSAILLPCNENYIAFITKQASSTNIKILLSKIA